MIIKVKEVKHIPKEEYITTWRNKWITSGAKSIDDFIATFEGLAKMFREWKEMGIRLDDDGGVGDDYAQFYTDDKDVAIKAGFIVQDMEGNKLLETRSGKDIQL